MESWRKFVTAFVCGTVMVAIPAAAQADHAQHIWDYGDSHGPSHWGELNPEYSLCSSGHHQSPVDIRNPEKADLPALEFDYKPSPLRIIDNGHTIMISYAPGSMLRVGGKTYELKQFHFHRPSEERINGKAYEMTVHLVHADQQGKLAVVAVLLSKGEENSLVHELWKELPQEEGKERVLDQVSIDVAKLLPARDRGYYTYSGSLTTPPCTEDVTWFVLKQPVAISAAEIERFSKLYRNDARPTQPVYDRHILETR